ncbi:MAG: DNA/RNA helicase domain-containing protein [Sulfolobaceae archaeon]
MLPLVLERVCEDTYDKLTKEYKETYFEEPSIEQRNAWRKLLSILKELNTPHPIIMEYPIFTERVDLIFVDKDKALVVEAKGWKSVKRVDDLTVIADEKLRQDPCYQLQNYVTKLNTYHSSNIKFEGLLFLYNTSDYSSECKIVRSVNELREELKNYPAGDENDVRRITEGSLELKQGFTDFVRKVKELKLKNVAKALVSQGFGLTEEQTLVLENVIKALEKGEEGKNFLIKGESGSGKSLLAVTLYLEALSRGYFAILSYKNNRLINVVRQALGSELSMYVLFYSTGRGFGIGEKRFEEWFKKRFGNRRIDLIVFDEAQRMTIDVMRNSPRGRINVYFIDDKQVLIGNEAGTEENFRKNVPNLEVYELSSPFREPKVYVNAVKDLLNGKRVTISSFEFRVFDDIRDMLRELENRKREGRKVALICSFTESRGDKDNPQSIENVRIGYPLPSRFDLYKEVGVNVRWLMDEETEYPKYWSGELDPLKYCSSVYGAQGFEAEYVGVVWGRDLVWRDGGWTVNSEPITDYVGGRDSLMDLAKSDKRRALELLKNRYYIMLTRATKGVYVFFEDKLTGEKVKELVSYKK